MGLREVRRQIDDVDARVVKLLNRRARLTLQAGRLKSRQRRGTFSADREQAIYRRLQRLNTGPFSDEAMLAVYREVVSAARALQRPTRVAYLGPRHTFTHQAAAKRFGSQVEDVECQSITDVFTEVERGRADYGVVPIENSIEGAITHTLDRFVDSAVRICAEVHLPITHHVLGRGSLRRVRKVYSHRQVFGQCRSWLEEHLPGVELVEVASTAQAARRVQRTTTAVAIASRAAAEAYGLHVLASSIEDQSDNVTRFLVIGQTQSQPTGQDKTSVVFAVKDRVGALHEVLGAFRRHGVNLTKIESRPSRRRRWEYVFFADVAGHATDRRVRLALRAVERRSAMLKVLGSYPTDA